MLVTVGSLLQVDPFPMVWIGLVILIQAVRMLRAEIRSIQGRSRRLESVAVSLIKRGEIAEGAAGTEIAAEDSTDPYARAKPLRFQSTA